MAGRLAGGMMEWMGGGREGQTDGQMDGQTEWMDNGMNRGRSGGTEEEKASWRMDR